MSQTIKVIGLLGCRRHTFYAEPVSIAAFKPCHVVLYLNQPIFIGGRVDEHPFITINPETGAFVPNPFDPNCIESDLFYVELSERPRLDEYLKLNSPGLKNPGLAKCKFDSLV